MILLRQKRKTAIKRNPGKIPDVFRGITRVCNEQCYNAKNKDCHCICGGLNHGVGEEQARKNGRVWFTEVAERDPSLEVVRHQGDLFEQSA